MSIDQDIARIAAVAFEKRKLDTLSGREILLVNALEQAGYLSINTPADGFTGESTPPSECIQPQPQ